jgi:hypothetical protein
VPHSPVFLFSLRVNTPLLAALLLEISFGEIPRSLLRGVSFCHLERPSGRRDLVSEALYAIRFLTFVRGKRVNETPNDRNKFTVYGRRFSFLFFHLEP